MMPREPDRYEAKARELVDLFVTTGTHITEMRSALAAALRREHDAALDEAADIADSYGCDYAARSIRALKSPAAAPAAETCRAEVASRMPDYSHFECTLPKGHAGPHREGSTEWTDAITEILPPSEPVAPAADVSALLGRGHVENPREGEPGDAETYSEPVAPAARDSAPVCDCGVRLGSHASCCATMKPRDSGKEET